jgi:hypothetical protein
MCCLCWPCPLKSSPVLPSTSSCVPLFRLRAQPSVVQATWVKASPTLFITNIPPGDTHLNLLEKTLRSRLRLCVHLCVFHTTSVVNTYGVEMYSAQPGFIPPMRIAKGGAIAFGDYETPQQATDCMLNLLGLQFPGWSGEGLKISYDKDDR